MFGEVVLDAKGNPVSNDFISFQSVFICHVDDLCRICGLFKQLILSYFYFIGLLPFALFLDCINIAADFKSKPDTEARGADINNILGYRCPPGSGEF